MGSVTAVFLGDRTLGVVAGRLAAKGVELTHAASVPLPEDFAARDLDGQAGAIREALNEAGGGVRSCVLVLPRPLAILRTFTLPPGSPEELQSMIRFQLEKDLPLPLDQVRYTYATALEDGKVRVTAVAVPIEALDKRLAALEKAGLRVTGAVVSSFGLIRLVPPGLLDGGSLLLNIADGSAEILIAEAGRLQLSRNSPMRELDSDALAAEIDRAMLSNTTREVGSEVRRILVAGEGEAAERVVTEIQRRIPAASVKVAVPNGTVTRRPDIRITTESAAAAGVLLGLLQPGPALPDLLRPPVVRRAMRFRRAHKIGAGAGILLAALVTWSQIALAGRRSELAGLQAQLATVKPKGDAVDRMRNEIRTLQQWQDRRFSWIDLFDQLQQRLPGAKIHLATMTIDEAGVLALKGKAKDKSDVIEFTTELQKVTAFAEVASDGIRPNSDAKSEYTQDFSLRITLADLAPPKKDKKPAKPASNGKK
ncbi:MAG TPA: pilus assembly protein PilM [Planctomycetota bacterium]|jgi:Tfp pilus assembly PilM family ATPase/Tfp pilus assembly protein PilN